MTLQKAPLATAGLILGLLGLGNLLKDIAIGLTILCGISAFLIWIYLVYSMVTDPNGVQKQYKNPLISSVFTTFFMSGFLATSYLKTFFEKVVVINTLIQPLWFLFLMGIISHMLVFSFTYLRRRDLTTVFPSWTVLYIGIAIAGLTSPVSGQLVIGQVTIFYGFIATCLVLPFIFKRLKQFPLEATFKPNTATICAPFSLVAAAYAVAFPEPKPLVMGMLLFLAQFFYFYIVFQLPKLLKRPFSPVFSAFTFPLVISATALKNSMAILGLTGLWQVLLFGEILLASFVVFGVLLGYLRFFLNIK